MTERWQRELHRLRSVTPPPTLQERVDEGPLLPAPPDRARRVVAGAVALALFAAVAFGSWVAFRSGEEPGRGPADDRPTPVAGEAIVTIRPPEQGSPRISVDTEGGTVEGTFISYCWDSGDSSMCADTVEPEIAEYALIGQGALLRFETTGEVRRVALGSSPRYPFDPNERLEGAEAVTLRADPGRYVLTIEVSWPQGDISFFVGIEVVEGATEPTPTTDAEAIEIACPGSDLTEIHTSVARVGPEGATIAIDNGGEASGIEVFPDSWDGGSIFLELVGNFRREVLLALVAPVGRARVACVYGEPGTSEDEFARAGPIELVDPLGVWHDDQLACAADRRRDLDGPYGFLRT